MIAILIFLVIIGLILWWVNSFPLQPWIATTINVIAIIWVLLYLLNKFGLYHSRVPGL